MSNTPTLVRRSRIGELLVAEGKLSTEELAAALAYREERGLKLGQALVALHLVTQQDLARALRSQGRVHCLHLSPGIVDPDVARLLPEPMARKYMAIPVHRVAGRVTVAMEDPSEEYDVDAIAVAVGEPIFAVHAEPERIVEAIARTWPATTEPAPLREAPRFTLVRGSLTEGDPGEAAQTLVRAALREARAIGAQSFHVESTSRGAEMSFRVGRSRTPAALFPIEWAEACTGALFDIAGAASSDERASGCFDLDGESLTLSVATISGQHGRCARATMHAPLRPTPIEDLELDPGERALVVGWLAASGVVLVVGAANSVADSVSAELARRAARSGARVYRLGETSAPDEGVVHVRRSTNGDTADELRAIREQSPEVVETGLLSDAPSFSAAFSLARRGALVLVRVEARDGAAAACEFLSASTDRASAAELVLGCIAIADVTADRTASSGGAAHRIAEVLDAAESGVRSAFAREPEAGRVREALRSLGARTLESRARDLVTRGLATDADCERALRRAAGVLS